VIEISLQAPNIDRMSTEPLQHELERYERELPALLAQEGRYVIIHGDDPIEIVDTYDDALKLGYEKFALVPFLVRQISRVQPVANFTRFSLTSCPS
jgi:hypothetical protein